MPTLSKSSLTEPEKVELASCEAIVDAGILSFVEVGNALIKISEGRLYRGTHGSFEPYVRERYNISARHAYRLCDAAKVVNELRPMGHTLETERQVREIAKVEPAKRVEVLEKAAKKGKITAASIKAAAKPVVEVLPIVDPVKLETDKWKEALGDVKLPEVKTLLQNAIADLQLVVTEALDNLPDDKLPAFKLELEVQARRVKEQIVVNQSNK
jgi:hypothetical protein